VLRAQPHGSDDADIYLVTTYKNWAALDDLDSKSDVIATQVYGSVVKASEGAVEFVAKYPGSMSMMNELCDVAVIGGGPSGSTAAALLARRGYKVIALEKAHHPRFHIGESLLPMNLPIFERLGVLDKVGSLGVFKRGADFEADNESGYNTYAFARAIGNSPPHAYQVWRQDFDKLLFDHARVCGADAREGHEAVKVEQNGPRETRLDVNTDDGRSYSIQARYVVDASGRDAMLSTKKKLRRKNTEHQSAAIFGHFRGALPRAGQDAGNISTDSTTAGCG
jgi:hypothetical protein